MLKIHYGATQHTLEIGDKTFDLRSLSGKERQGVIDKINTLIFGSAAALSSPRRYDVPLTAAA